MASIPTMPARSIAMTPALVSNTSATCPSTAAAAQERRTVYVGYAPAGLVVLGHALLQRTELLAGVCLVRFGVLHLSSQRQD